MNNLDSVNGNLWIWNNPSLESLEGLHHIKTITGGDLWLDNNKVLKNLSGLRMLNTIKGSLNISGNPALTSLAGLDKLSSIKFDLWVLSNDSLKNLSGLENLNSIGRDLWIYDNPSLIMLRGIENIDKGTISSLYVVDNPLLTNCEVKSICDYLNLPAASVEINGNSRGCDSREEILSACKLVSSGKVSRSTEGVRYSVVPNPNNGHFQFSMESNAPGEYFCKVLASNGQVIETRKVKPAGINTMEYFDISHWGKGLYYFVITTDKLLLPVKIVVR